jgi:23S rRNA (uracil1939-C5)-methyltransferase/tRNA (uracil-5-)-methyltransferase
VIFSTLTEREITPKRAKHTKENHLVSGAFVYWLASVAKKKKPFNDHPFGYHEEIELEIGTLTNLGSGLGRVALPGEAEARWVVMVPFTLPGERVRARVFRNHKNFSEADLVSVLTPSAHRVTPRCPLFGRCGGCQYQHLAYTEQLAWKGRQVAELLQHMAGVAFPVAPTIASPREYGYRSKITPHFNPPRGESGPVVAGLAEAGSSGAVRPGSATPATPTEATATETAANVESPSPPSDGDHRPPLRIGFLRQGTRFDIVDVPHCPIATDAINARLTEVRAAVQANRDRYTRGATLLLREASGVVTTDYDAIITEEIPVEDVAGLVEAGSRPGSATSGTRGMAEGGPGSATPATAGLRLRFLARDFFQNNPFILPAFTGYVRRQAAASGARFLVDAYCGSGLFALTAASAFERVAGVEISASSVAFARENAAANGIANATFLAGDAGAIFAGLEFPAADTVVVIDPPRKGCDESFLAQLFAYGPRSVVYVSCDPATQMRDLHHFLAAGYALTAAQPFDLFPQTRHLECVLTLRRGEAADPGDPLRGM